MRRAAALVGALLLVAGCDRFGGARTAFDADQAMRYLETQLSHGPRIPGSPGWQRTGDLIAERLRATADTLIEQRWTHVTQQGDTLPMRNLFAQFRPEAAERVLYVTHWDTRPVSDAPSVTDPARQAMPVPGANDGASGTAVLLALADLMARTPPDVGVDLLFVDGEDYGEFPNLSVPGALDTADVLIGSKYFAANPPVPGYQPIFGVLWDMVGDRDLEFPREGFSLQGAPEVVERVWAMARDLGYGDVFVDRAVGGITDDHVPLLQAGYRVIDVIDLDYPAHHTPEDTIDKVSTRSLRVVGDVAAALVGLRN